MSNKKLLHLILVVITVLGLITRLINLADFPGGFTPDETAFGYNAYSLLLTGRDEWGTDFWSLPLTNLRSFGDYKLPLLAFLTVPFVSVFGLDIVSTRLPNAILGGIAPLLLSLLVIRHLSTKISPRKAISLGGLAGFILLFSPWHFSLSRGSFEANLISFFLPLCLLLLLSRRYLLYSLIAALGVYSYHTARLLLPVMFIGSALLFFREKKPLLLFLLISFPTLVSLFSFNARTRDVSIFNPDDNWAAMANARLQRINSGESPIIAKLFANKLTFTLPKLISNYTSYFSPQFLVKTGAAEATYGMIPGTAVFPVWPLLFVVPFFFFFVLKSPTSFSSLVALSILLAPLPAALAKGPGYAGNRAAPLLLLLLIGISIGLGHLVKYLSLRKVYLLTGFLSLFAAISFVLYLGVYIDKSPNMHAHSMGYGLDKLSAAASSASVNFDRVYISRSLSEPHIYIAFYQKIPPRFYQHYSPQWREFEALGFRFLDQYSGYRLGPYVFGDLPHDQPALGSKIIVFGRAQEMLPIWKFYPIADYPDQLPAIVAAEIKR